MEVLAEKTGISRTESEESYSPSYTKNSFFHFFFFVFSVALQRVEGKYIYPSYLKDFCGRLQFFKRTSTIAPRFHLKSTLIEAYIMWKLYRMEHNFNEWMYFSYTGELAAYHTKRIKRYFDALPEVYGQYRNMTDSESIISYRGPEGNIFFCEPVGILTFKRGKHPNGLICDDILRDPQTKLDFSQLDKITRAFFEEIEQMPKEELHLVGTPQDQEDLLSILETKKGYNCKRYDVYVDESRKKTLWPQLFHWEELEDRRKRIGEKAFNKEFRCRPVRGEEGFVHYLALARIINKRLKNYTLAQPPLLRDRLVIGGLDIGKKTHPSHLTVFAQRNMKLVQIHSKFMDEWNYNDQVAYCRMAIEKFGMQKLMYDDTRSEFEGIKERGELPTEMEGVAFTADSKFKMATEFDIAITNKAIEFINDERQKRQILTVDCDLKAPETQDGHGDSFFSNCLAVMAWRAANSLLVWSPSRS